jgi:uncharacterized membrane protein YoaK (UPF0700 family)
LLHGNENIANYSKSNMAIWSIMSFQAGFLNIVGFLTCKRFVSHVTGFATFLGADVAENRYQDALGMLAVPVFYLLGSMLSAQLVDIRLLQHKKPKFYVPFGIIFLLISLIYTLGSLNFLEELGGGLSNKTEYFLLAVLCLACGMQNATTTSVSKSVIRTTHLTGTTTDLGISLVRIFNRNKVGIHLQSELLQITARILIISAFVIGSICGAVLFRELQFTSFFLPAFTSSMLFFATLHFQYFLRRNPKISL